MPDVAKAIKPEEIIEIVLRRRWFILIPLTISMLIGTYLILTLPRIYGASTLILVQPQRVPSNYVQSVVSVGIESRISTISQQIMSRTNIEKIIGQFKFFQEPESAKMYIEDKIENIRKRISVNVTKARSGADAFSISFKDKDPDRVMRVANTLATFFIDENLKLREAQAIGTSNFLEDELKNMEKRLQELEIALKDYRQKYMGELPEQLQTNLTILDRLQFQLNEKQKSLRDAKNMLIALEKQISEMQNQQNDLSGFNTENMFEFEEEDSMIPIELEQLQKKLETLETKYTDRHPDVARIKKIIAEKKAQIEEAAAERAEETNQEAVESEIEVPEINYQELQTAQRNEIRGEIGIIQTEISEILKQVGIYQKRVEDTPKREQELLSIKRDYQNIKDSYNSLLGRKLEAEIAVNMEKKQKGEQFLILDPARLPQKPIEPNEKRLFILTLAAGFAIGFGFVFLLEYFDASLKRPEDIESLLGLSVIAAIPAISHTEENRTKERLRWLFGIIFSFLSLMLFVVFSILAFKGVDQTLEIIKRFVKI